MNKPECRLRTASLLGRQVLDAWLCGDRVQLSRNLKEVNAMPIQLTDSAERDRLETLKAIAERMWSIPDSAVSRAQDPRIGSWLNLLDHLAGADGFDSERGAAAVGHHLAFKPRLAVHQAFKQ